LCSEFNSQTPEVVTDVGQWPTISLTSSTTTGRNVDHLGVYFYARTRACERGSVTNNYKNVSRKIIQYIMNTRQTTRNRFDQEMAYCRSDINDDAYDEFWRDRQLPGNKEIYSRNAELARRRDQECEARSIKWRYATRGSPGPRLHRPQGRATGPVKDEPRERDTGFGGTPYPGEGRRLTVTGFNFLVERARELRLAQGLCVSPPVCQSPIGDCGSNMPTSPTRPTIQGR